jgi:hypothetical protein
LENYIPPNNPQEYWLIVETYWNDIKHILNLYLPTFQAQWIDKTPLSVSLGEYIEELKNEHNPRLVRALNAAWFAAPDDIGIWSHKSWNVLCDLCSEEYVLYEPKERDDT